MLGLETTLNLVLYISIPGVVFLLLLVWILANPVEIPHLHEETGPSQGGKKTFQVTSGQRLTIQLLT